MGDWLLLEIDFVRISVLGRKWESDVRNGFSRGGFCLVIKIFLIIISRTFILFIQKI
jgi:hypothetical protein